MKAKTKVKLSFLLLDVLDLFEDALFLGSRPGMNRMGRYWGYAERRDAYRTFQRWQAEKYLEKIERGNQVLYGIGEAGKKFLAQHRPNVAARNRSWDGRWRIVMFDFPEVARKARNAFRRELRSQRMGRLQHSVWITPDPVIPAWRALLQQLDLTDWVLLFESTELGPVEDAEIARRVWNLDGLATRYQNYLTEHRSVPGLLRNRRRPELEGQANEAARRAFQKYLLILRDDPVLPKSLLPSNFPAMKADALHRDIRTALRNRLTDDRH